MGPLTPSVSGHFCVPEPAAGDASGFLRLSPAAFAFGTFGLFSGFALGCGADNCIQLTLSAMDTICWLRAREPEQPPSAEAL